MQTLLKGRRVNNCNRVGHRHFAAAGKFSPFGRCGTGTNIQRVALQLFIGDADRYRGGVRIDANITAVCRRFDLNLRWRIVDRECNYLIGYDFAFITGRDAQCILAFVQPTERGQLLLGLVAVAVGEAFP